MVKPRSGKTVQIRQAKSVTTAGKAVLVALSGIDHWMNASVEESHDVSFGCCAAYALLTGPLEGVAVTINVLALFLQQNICCS